MLKHENTSKHATAILTKKYKESHGEDIKPVTKSPDDESYACACGRKYKFSSGLWRHNKMCNGNNIFIGENQPTHDIDGFHTQVEPIVQKMVTPEFEGHCSSKVAELEYVPPGKDSNVSNICIPSNNPTNDVIYELLKNICVSNTAIHNIILELQSKICNSSGNL